MREQPRIRGATGEAMVEAALSAQLGSMWTGPAGQIGLNQPRSDWRSGMRAALEAAFAELLKEPSR